MKKKIKKVFKVTLTTVLFILAAALPVAATETTASVPDGDVINIMGNLNNLIFGIVRAIGIGFAAWGLLNFGTSFSSHDSSQRATGLSNIVGGLVMIFAKQILSTIGAI